MSVVYLDTSVLANRYLRGRISEAVDTMLDDEANEFAMSELSLTEFESALTRQHREGRITARRLHDVRLRFENDLRLGFFSLLPLTRPVLVGARQLIADGRAPLATLDSIHLQTAIDVGAELFATDDRQLARAAGKHGFALVRFSL